MSAQWGETVSSRRKGIHRDGAAARRGRAAAALAGSAALIALGLAGPAAATNAQGDPNNIVVNGAFTAPALGAGADVDVLAGATTITGWTVTGTDVNVNSPGFFNTPSGDPASTQSIDLNGNQPTPSGITQSLNTTAGVTYTGSFELAGNPGAPTTKTGTFQIGTAAPVPFSFDTTGQTASTLAWQNVPFSFTAAGPTTTLAITSTTPSSVFGPLVTDVVVDPPATNGSPIADPAVAAGSVGVLGALALGMHLLRRRHVRATS